MFMDKQQLVRDAYGMIGVKYAHQGRNEFAVDCIGLLAYIFEKQECVAEYPKNYERVPKKDQIYYFLNERFNQTSTFEPGNIILFKGKRVYYHAGLLVAPDKMIHAFNAGNHGTGSVILTSLSEEANWLKADYVVFDTSRLI